MLRNLQYVNSEHWGKTREGEDSNQDYPLSFVLFFCFYKCQVCHVSVTPEED